MLGTGPRARLLLTRPCLAVVSVIARWMPAKIVCKLTGKYHAKNHMVQTLPPILLVYIFMHV